MKQLVSKSIATALGVVLVTPLLMAPTAVNGSLKGFSSNVQGVQNPESWDIPQSIGQNSADSGKVKSGETGQPGAGESYSQSGGGQSGAGGGSAAGEGTTDAGSDGGSSGSSSHSGSSSGSGSSGGSGSGSQSSGSGDLFPPLDLSDSQYDPSDNSGDQQVPSGCAEEGSACAQCVQTHEATVQFNRRYLHVAWSTTHQTIEYTERMIRFGDAVSGIHSTQALAWQLAGKPQITEAVTSLRKTYDTKYNIYIENIKNALEALNQCEQDNFAVRNLYQQFSSLYLDFVKTRYQSPD